MPVISVAVTILLSLPANATSTSINDMAVALIFDDIATSGSYLRSNSSFRFYITVDGADLPLNT